MRWKRGRRSSNIEDRRGRRVSGGLKLGGGLTIVIVIGAMLLGVDPSQILGLLGGGDDDSSSTPTRQPGAAENQAADFVSVVLADTEDAWSGIFAARGGRYQPPTLVLFTDQVRSACGFASAASGPFYCPGDQKVYLDTGFFDQLKRLGAPGDFAQAYVIGHEVGHHVQRLLGIEPEVRRAQRSSGSKAEVNRLSVLMELQADCFAGVWAHHGQRDRNILEAGDIDEGLRAAASIGDDRLQRNAGRAIQPESFTHGTSAQRMQWLRRGLETGDVEACNTFGGDAF